MRSYLGFVAGLVLLLFRYLPGNVHAQTSSASNASADVQSNADTGQSYIERGKVLTIVSQTVKEVPGTMTTHSYQTITALILTGHDKGKRSRFRTTTSI